MCVLKVYASMASCMRVSCCGLRSSVLSETPSPILRARLVLILILELAEVRLGPAVGGTDLTFSLVLRQIRLTVHATRPSVRVLVADRQQYREHDMLPVLLQSARGSDKAFEQAMFRKSARLQQRRQAGG